ncbi:hypothetical protein PTQ19_15045 [Microbacterium esteraromaticum]|uniref:hypothetical protein n=1 Tax=Microbacterium esteraromaticum TaxID=57043 RepID=UPI002368C969|nr:hypothetical protein [Microbacterium esteraromaticum]WDH78804.1 hypothetical protein PTQ19_15045 [Microbacterium esteraromaticum]
MSTDNNASTFASDELTLLDHELELITDGDGVAVIGPPAAVEQFLTSRGLESRELALQKLGTKMNAASGITQAGSQIAENSGRWIKLTEKSAKALGDLPPMKGSSSGVARAIVMKNGKTKHILEFVRTPGKMLTNPAILTGAAGIMAQMAMQQTMDEIIDYLAKIDAKVDDVLRAQKDAALADMIGVEFVIEEAMTIREQVGFVSETTWSKVQATTATVASTQAYALRQLDALAEKLERTAKMSDLANLARDAETVVQEWLAVLARCFQLQDATAVLEIDRVLDESPDDPSEVERHRRGLRAARDNRKALIARSTLSLLARMDAAATRANAKVLLSPTAAPRVIRSSNAIGADVSEFHSRLSIGQEREAIEAKRWRDAAGDARDGVVTAGAGAAQAVGRFAGETADNARVGTGKLLSGLGEKLLRKDADVPGEDEPK